jgi:uridine kinase
MVFINYMIAKSKANSIFAEMSKNIVIAIDGYSSCGKSTIAKALAKKTAFYLYRYRSNVPCSDAVFSQASN